MSDMRKILKAEAFFAGNIRREKDSTGSSRTITGSAIVFGQRSLPLWADEDEAAYEIIDDGAVTEATLKNSDILLTMFHDREKLLGRCRNGEGSMQCGVDKNAVTFSCALADTAIGNEALSAVERGDITGCSFIGDVAYDDYQKVVLDEKDEAGRTVIEYHVKNIICFRDFTITPSPAYPETETEVKRELRNLKPADAGRLREQREAERRSQLEDMLSHASFRPFGMEW